MTLSTASQTAVRSRRVQASIGMPAESNYLDHVKTLINRAPQAAQTHTFTVTTYTDGATYTVVINGISISYVAVTADVDTSGVAAKIAQAINAEPAVRGQVSAAAVANVITVTGTWPDLAFTATESDAKITNAAGTSPAAAAAVLPGRLMVSQGFIANEAEEQGAVAAETLFTAQVDTLALTYVAAAVYTLSITVGGQTYIAQKLADTDATTTAQALADTMNDLLPADTVDLTETGGTITMTAEIAGLEFSVAYGASKGATTPVFTYVTGAGIGTSLARAARGVSLFPLDEENQTIAGDDVAWAKNAGVAVLKRGRIWVASEQTIANGDPVFVELDGSANSGRLYNTGSSTRVRLFGASWERDSESVNADAIALVNLAL